jgi:hypothetical protein
VKQARWLLLAGLVVMMMTIGCEKQMGFVEPKDDVNIAWHWEPDPDTWTLFAGQSYEAGTVVVWNTPETLYVEYNMADLWWLKETHVHVDEYIESIPNKNGNPSPGQFEYSKIYTSPVQIDTYKILVEPGWLVGDYLYIATHALAFTVGQSGDTTWQTGWAGDEKLPGKKWHRIIKYEFKKSFKDVNLPRPPTTVTMTGQYYQWIPGYNESYWKITLSGVPSVLPPYDVWDGNWRGWCAQSGITWNGGANSVTLWSTANPSLPAHLQNPGWDNVNWLLNNHDSYNPTVRDLQDAFWILLGQDPWWGGWGPFSALAEEMAEEANEHGNGWYPTSGDWIAVICDNGTQQRCFIEVDP